MHSMTVADLLSFLADLPGDHLVVLAKDAEGNSFSPLSGAMSGVYRPDSLYSGWVSEDGPDNAVVLWPVN